MIEFELNLIPGCQSCDIMLNGHRAVISTGSKHCVIMLPEDELRRDFNAEPVRDGAYLVEFGKKVTGKIWESKELVIGRMIFSPFQFFVPDVHGDDLVLLGYSELFSKTYMSFDLSGGKTGIGVDSESELHRSAVIEGDEVTAMYLRPLGNVRTLE